MTGVLALAALWLALALIASLLSIWLRISTAPSEIVVGTVAQLIIGAIIGSAILGTDESRVKFLAGIGAIVLTFLAGAELDPQVFRLKWKGAVAVGLASFFRPFLGCAAAAYYLLGWDVMPSWLAGVAMSTTSLAVVHVVMLEFGFNATLPELEGQLWIVAHPDLKRTGRVGAFLDFCEAEMVRRCARICHSPPAKGAP